MWEMVVAWEVLHKVLHFMVMEAAELPDTAEMAVMLKTTTTVLPEPAVAAELVLMVAEQPHPAAMAAVALAY
jgi:NACalpha-BTF3-like transcription factor